MINSLLTIVIPCKNSVYGLKNTVESLLNQFKIQGTRVLVLDLGSDDGSYQYAAQASFEHFKKLKIESIKVDSELNLFKFIDELRTLTLFSIRLIRYLQIRMLMFILKNIH